VGFRELGCGVDGEVWRVCAEGVVVCFFAAVGHDLEIEISERMERRYFRGGGWGGAFNEWMRWVARVVG